MTSLYLLLLLIFLIALTVLLVRYFNKNENKALKNIIIGLSWVLTLFAGYKIYDGIQAPIRFDKLKQARFQAAVTKLIDLKTAQTAYKTVKGRYTDNLDSLVAFIETEKFQIIERKDTSVADVERNRAFGLSDDSGYYKDIVITRKIGEVSIKDSLFRDSDRYLRLNRVRVEGMEAPVKMESGFIVRNNIQVPVFKATIQKSDLLTDQDPDLVSKENKTMSVDGINGSEIILGSMEEVNLNGNWPQKYGKNE